MVRIETLALGECSGSRSPHPTMLISGESFFRD